MNEKQTMEYVEETGKYGSVLGLDSMRELCRRIGDPQKNLTFLHIAGTNGKGSLLAYLSTILKEAGYRTGRYLSPTIFEYRERIQVNERYITKKALCEGFSLLKEKAEQMVAEGFAHPTIFEMETALAFWYFVKTGCDFVVLETGLGGRLDATNVIENTVACILTSISMDHMQFLGNSLAEIAAQKAGILKRGSVVISMPQQEEAAAVIKQKAEELGCPLTVLDMTAVRGIKYGIKKQVFCYKSYEKDKKLEITMAGKYQVENAALAVAVVEELRTAGYDISDQALREGLLHTVWKGRFQVIANKPLVITDGAHNEDAAKKLAESLALYFEQKRIIYVMGVLRDKEYDKMLQITLPLAAQVITVTPPGNKRALSAYELAQAARQYHETVTAADSLEEAAELAYLLADKDTVIVAFGSLFFLGDFTRIIENKTDMRSDSHGK